MGRDTVSEPRHVSPPAPVHEVDPRHRRAVSTVSEAEHFLPPLTSPFSPPAFNPYDVVLGSNEAIAGLDSPLPVAANKSRRDEAFSWLDDKLGNMKSSKSTNCLPTAEPSEIVFQFPSVSNSEYNMDLSMKNNKVIENIPEIKIKDHETLNEQMRRMEEEKRQMQQQQLLFEEQQKRLEEEKKAEELRKQQQYYMEQMRLKQEQEEAQRRQEQQRLEWEQQQHNMQMLAQKQAQ